MGPRRSASRRPTKPQDKVKGKRKRTEDDDGEDVVMGDAEAPKLEADTVKKEVAEEPEQPKKKKAKTKKSEKVDTPKGSDGIRTLDNNVFLLSIPPGMTEEFVREYYETQLAPQNKQAEKNQLPAVLALLFLKNGYGAFIGQGVVSLRTPSLQGRVATMPPPTWNHMRPRVEQGGRLHRGPPQTEIHIRGLPPGTKEEHLIDYYDPLPGERRIKLVFGKACNFIGEAVIGFQNAATAAKAMAMGPPTIEGVQATVQTVGRLPAGLQIFVQGPMALSDDDIYAQYKGLGEDAVHRIAWRERPGKTDGKLVRLGHVGFRTEELRNKALKMGPFKASGGQVTVEECRPDKEEEKAKK